MGGRLPASSITSTTPFDKDGKYTGFLDLPCSRESSAWGSVRIPIVVVRNGAGPTALLTGANHGDEYEGPVALQALAHDLEPDEVTGRAIIVPFMNLPAFQSAKRLSPLDGINLNRCFPGHPSGSPTERIADYFVRTLIPMADFVLDFHSGGKSLDFIPFAAAHVLGDAVQQRACIDAMRAFNAPYSMILKELDPGGMYDTAVEQAGKVFVSTELGGGGTVTASSARIARRGVRSFLRHAGILANDMERAPSLDIDTTKEGCFHFAEHSGLIEPLVDLGQEVKHGDAIANIWPNDRAGNAPIQVESCQTGLLAARHFPGLIATGDCLAVVATIVS